MRLEYYSSNKLKKEIKTIVGKWLDLNKYKLFFFGGSVIGKGSDRSDIDIGIVGPRVIKASVLTDIQDQIERLSTLYKIEIVDFKQVDEKFKRVALQKIENIS